MLKTNYIGCLTVVIDTNAVEMPLMPLIRKRQDYATWLLLLRSLDAAHCIPEVLAAYRESEKSLSSSKINLLMYNWKVFRDCENLGLLASFFYLSCNVVEKIIGRKA